MGSQLAGDPDDFPDDFTIPDDSDPPTASAVNVGFEALANRTAWLKAHGLALGGIEDITATGTWPAPEGAMFAILEGHGAGGGGGGGHAPLENLDRFASGGGGGGAAQRGSALVELEGGAEYGVSIGAGGAGGSGATLVGSPTSGSDGGDTIFLSPESTELARFSGAGGGRRGDYLDTADSHFLSFGGRPTRGAFGYSTSITVTTALASLSFGGFPGAGGEGVTNQLGGRSGSRSIAGFAGGAGGSNGVDDGTKRGGGAGGGGAAGPRGVGGAAGNGASPQTEEEAPSGAGGDGTAAAANTGAGGGGGGGGSISDFGVPRGGNGGAGGSGFLRIYWFKKGMPDE